MATARHTQPLNQNWATGAFVTRDRDRDVAPQPAPPTQFETIVHRLQLDNAPHRWPTHSALRQWVKANKNQRYVPEELLNAMGMHVILSDY
jgi:hypothetical protein